MDNLLIETDAQTWGLRSGKLYSESPTDLTVRAFDVAPVNGHAARGDDEIAALAVELWRVRGCPENSLGKDWRRAREILRSGAYAG